jgi:anti-sigma factor RsiW
MAADPDCNDFVRLNAFVDGELSPAERAAVAARLASDPEFARAHATLARLKACVHEIAPEPAIAMQPERRRATRRMALLWAAAAAAAACLAAATIGELPLASVPTLKPQLVAATSGGLPTRPVLPRLDIAGLRLVGVTAPSDADAPIMVASYVGPHGCKLELHARPAGRELPAVASVSRYGWVVGEIGYELVAHGMPDWRFALVSQAAELQTRGSQLPQGVQQRLREARSSAPPCAG